MAVKAASYSLRQQGRHVYISQKSFAAEQNIDLTQVLTSIPSWDTNETSPSEDSAYVHIYCDTLGYSSSDYSEFPRLEWLRIFARRLDGPTKLLLSNVKCLFLVVEDIPNGLEVSVATGQFERVSPCHSTAVGTQFIGSTCTTIENIDPVELNRRAFHDYLPTAQSRGPFLGLQSSSTHVSASGTDSHNKPDPGPKYTVPFELAVLLGSLFREAANNSCALPSSKEAEKSRSICRFVKALTEWSATQADLFSQASTLLERLTIPPGIPEETCFYVPNRPAAVLKDTLDAWKETAITINKSYTDTELKALISKGFKNTIKVIIQKQIEFTNQDNKFQVPQLKRRVDDASRAVNKAEVEYQAYEREMKTQHAAFQANISKWREAREHEARIAALISVVEIVVVVGEAVVTLGATSPNAVSSLSDLIENVQGMRETSEKVAEVKTKVDTLTDLEGKLKQVHTCAKKAQVWNLQRGITPEDPMEVVMGTAKKIDQVPATTLGNFDFYALQTLWEDFAMDQEETFKDLEAIPEPKIPGLGDYRMAVRKMIVRARNLIAAQKEHQEAQNAYMRAVLYSDHLNKREVQYSDKKMYDASDEEAAQALRLFLKDDQTAINRWLFLSLHEWALSRMYEIGVSYFPVQFKMHEELLDYQSTIASFESKLNNLTLKAPDCVKDPLIFSTKDEDSIFPGDWKKTLQEKQGVEFCITVDKADAKPFSYITEARAMLVGIRKAEQAEIPKSKRMNNDLELEIEFGPKLGQQNADESVFYCHTSPIKGDYAVNAISKEVIVPAKFASGVLPSLYSQGKIGLQKKAKERWDVTSVDEVQLEVWYQYHKRFGK